MKLDLRKLVAIPVMKTREKEGDILRACVADGVIVIDGYRDGQYQGRYILQTGTWKYRTYNNGKWHKKKLISLFEERYYGYSRWTGRFSKKQEEALVYKALDNSGVIKTWWRRDVIGIIDKVESEYLYNRRERALERKQERFNEMDRNMPPVAYSAWQYFVDCIGMPEFLIWDKEEDTYRCSACNGKHRINGLKHNDVTICPNTGKQVTVKRRCDRIEMKGKLQLIQEYDVEWSVSRFFDMTVSCSLGGKNIIADEAVRIFLGRGKMKGKTKVHYAQCARSDRPKFGVIEKGYIYARSAGMWDTNSYNRRYGEAYLYPDGVNKALEGTVYEKLRMQEMAQKGYCLDYNRIMANHNKAAWMEYIVKLGLGRLAKEESGKLRLNIRRNNTFTGSNYYDGNLNIKGNSAEQIIGLDRQRILRLRDNNGGGLMLSWLRHEAVSGCRVTDEVLKFFEENGVRADGIKGLLDKMSPTKAMNYLKKQREQYPKESVKDLITTWADYMSMAKRLKMDTDDEVVYRTKDLVRRHDELAELIAEMGDDMIICEIAGKFPNVEDNLKAAVEKFSYADGEYFIRVPENIREILEDGRQLHHCAASSERYFDRINRKETYLMFCRKIAEPDKAFYTLEVQPDGTVRQKRTFYNRQENMKQIQGFLRKWQKEVKKKLTKQDRELGRKSAIQNEIDIILLLVEGNHKPSSVRVANELIKDRMEA